MKNCKQYRVKLGMSVSVVSAFMLICIGFSGCKGDTVYVDRIVEKPVDTIAPAAVTNLVATAKESRVLLTWTDAADTDIYGYEVSYSGTSAINRAIKALDKTSMIAPHGAGGCYVSGLSNGIEYTFTVKTVDTNGNKSVGVTAKATPKTVNTTDTMQIALSASVPQKNKNGETYKGNKSNTKVTVTANITTASNVKKVVWKKNGSLIAKTLLADTEASQASVDGSNNAVWTFDITATDESANGVYTVAAIDEAGREEAEQIIIDNFDFTPPEKAKNINGVYSRDLSIIILNWTEPDDIDFDHISITYTYNNGTTENETSSPTTVKKGSINKTFTEIIESAAYYTYKVVSVDSLGNESSVRVCKVSVNTAVSNCPDGFVEVKGGVYDGTQQLTPSSSVFIIGRTIEIADMYVCDHEVTQKEYETFCIYGEDRPKEEYGLGDNYPVYFISWYDAIVYCNLRSIAEGLTPAYKIGDERNPSKWDDIQSSTIGNVTKYCGPAEYSEAWTLVDRETKCYISGGVEYDITADGYRLPTEAEWEYIARNRNNDTYTYSGSNTIADVAWYELNSGGTSHEVKTTNNANGLGIYDMSGNVKELCWDLLAKHIDTSTPATGPTSSPFDGGGIVYRGGDAYYDKSYCTVFYRPQEYNRIGAYPYEINDVNTGFRIVRTVQ